MSSDVLQFDRSFVATFWSVRIMVSTQDFHSCNRSSILLQTTNPIISIGIIINNLIKSVMAKSNQTASEAQLKARRTSLGKKSNDELISIILRKDKSERSMNSKIQELQALLKEADELNEEKATRILGFDKDMKGMEEILKIKQEQIDNLLSDKNKLTSEVEEWSKKYVKTKAISKLRRGVIFTCFGIIAILIVLLILF